MVAPHLTTGSAGEDAATAYLTPTGMKYWFAIGVQNSWNSILSVNKVTALSLQK